MDEGSDKAPRRKRVSRACDRCRSKKDKCDGIRPTCSACQATGQSCSYDPHAKKRGLPEGYVRGLEKLWALSICNIDGFEDNMLAMLGATADSADRRAKLMSIWSEDTSSESLHETWKTSRLYGALEKMLSSSEQTPATAAGTGKRSRNPNDDLDGGWGYRFGRESSPLGPTAPRIVGPVSLSHSSSHSPTAKRTRLAQSQSQSQSQSHSHPQSDRGITSSSPQTLQLPAQTSQLLDIYFAATHSWLPILAKHNTLRASYLYANTAVSLTATSPGSGDHAALWAILSYTITQSRTDPRSSPAGTLSLAKEYYTISRHLIPLEKDRYELGHIQALLLLTLVNMGLEDWTAAWLLSGQAVRMAIAIGLGTSTDMRRSDETRQGKAVFLGCFVIDSLLSFRLRRCPAMSANDIAPVGLLEEDGLEEWNSWADVLPTAGASTSTSASTAHGKVPPRRGPLMSLSCFNRLVELASVLNKISRNLSMGYKPSTFAQQLVMDLKQWDDGLPLGCRLIGPESIYPERHSALLPHQSYLGLTYVATLLWLYISLIPGEQGLHRSQRPATEGAKKLLYRGLSMLAQHLDNFPICGLPPMFEFGLRTISEQAFSLRQNVDAPDSFPFVRWADEFRQKTAALVSSWPAYGSLVVAMERSQQTQSQTQTQPNGYNPSTTTFGSGVMPAPITGVPSVPVPVPEQVNYASSIMGISMPVDGQSLTPKDTIMENTDLAMMPVDNRSGPLEPMEMEKLPQSQSQPQQRPDAVYPSHPQPHPHPHQHSQHPSTPDSPSILSNSTNPNPNPYPTSNSIPGPGPVPVPVPEDLDAIFKDLAYLDTTEWSHNREAGLKDFGFLR
ncbi:hypothetical protein N7481_013488 [Penicillium waksmanii]|uniref:uncharacterized protein n=1 Tax=Penicillium waksmanii TaxID=69791 RepID=UPI00254917B8|nr:uncharacterized protein N7481_013488 [Penicillium waksmanii]KAJ5963183.1 hypothetical protein N7481_013488 [Penicillium waksmanii]